MIGLFVMKPIVIYSTQLCGYCAAAKRLLASKGLPFEEIDVARDPARRSEMMERAGGRHTVPQIFIGDVHVGGYDDISGLERAGKLDPLLN